MKIGRKEILMGVIFALFIAIFINYNSIERIFDTTREFNEKMLPPLIFSVAWFFVISMIYYMLYILIFNLSHKHNRPIITVLVFLVVSLSAISILVGLYPEIRELVLPTEFQIRRPPASQNRIDGVTRGLNSSQFLHILVAIMNLLFVYIQRLLYRNQEIERRNEQLQLQSVKSQHSALIQQINPHFFFNSLGSLRYIILKRDTDDAVEFLDNLTTIFRKTLKMSGNTLHTLREEIELTHSYIHIIEKRFSGKILVTFDIGDQYCDYLLSPLSILTLMENVVKHNTLSVKNPVRVRIYTTTDDEIVVENNIVHKFEEVESNGIGLINLNKQYLLLTNKGVEIISEGDAFIVKLPLIKEML